MQFILNLVSVLEYSNELANLTVCENRPLALDPRIARLKRQGSRIVSSRSIWPDKLRVEAGRN